MIDFHCHLDLFPDPSSVLEQIESHSMYVLVVTTTPKAWAGTSRLVADRKRIRVSPGLHPELAGERHAEAAFLCHLIGQSPYVGEVGLDGSPQHRHSFAKQELVLERAIRECVALGGRVISMHSRGAATGVLDMIESHPGLGMPVLHWFSGRPKELDRAVSMGCWFSVGPAMTRSNKGRALIEAMPSERILTETDSPFVQSRSGPLMPWDVMRAQQDLAEIWQKDTETVERQLILNLSTLTKFANGLKIKQGDRHK